LTDKIKSRLTFVNLADIRMSFDNQLNEVKQLPVHMFQTVNPIDFPLPTFVFEQKKIKKTN
jgi:hypothetical protein